MRNIQKLLIGIFCLGVVLAGAGTGIMFLEFSAFSYAGEKEAGIYDKKTVELDYSFEDSEGELITIRGNYRRFSDDNTIIESEIVPENTVRFIVTYNANTVEPYINSYKSDETSEEYLNLDWFYVADDFKNFMSVKDDLLAGIKNREIASYRSTGIEKIKIMVNPVSRERVQID